MESGLIVPFGRYVLKERLAQGGMGEVFRAVAVGEHGFEKPVVVKRVLPAHAGRDDLTDLFVAEAKLMTRLAHPNIVEVLDFGRGEHKDYYLVLELVEGTDLGRLMRAVSARGETFPVPLALFIASQVLRGLHHAHTKSAGEGAVIVHRDVSPSNVLCSTEGEVKVADFGVALVHRAGQERERDGGVAGKPGYMAPEQFDGGAVDPRADVFSAAVVLQQMITGALPFRGETQEEQQEAARRGAREPIQARRPDAGEAVDAILARGMAPRAADRFPDARAMAQAIEALRERGQRIAGGDDLAEAVRAAQRELPATGRKVIALTGSSGPASDEPRELTRTGAPGSVGAFTLRLPVRADATTRPRDELVDEQTRRPDGWSAPEPRTERIAPEERPAADLMTADLPAPEGGERLGTLSGSVPDRNREEEPTPAPADAGRQRVIRWAAVTAVAAFAVLGLVAFAVHAPPEEPPRIADAPPSAPSPVAAATAVAPGPAARPEGTQAPQTPAPRPSPRMPATIAPVSTAPAGTPAPPTVAPASAAQPPELCAGDVAFYSDGLWVVSGGPSTVQSPNTGVVWKCGTYTLVATSRVDPTQQKTRTVTVGPKHHTVVDLR